IWIIGQPESNMRNSSGKLSKIGMSVMFAAVRPKSFAKKAGSWCGLRTHCSVFRSRSSLTLWFWPPPSCRGPPPGDWPKCSAPVRTNTASSNPIVSIRCRRLPGPFLRGDVDSRLRPRLPCSRGEPPRPMSSPCSTWSESMHSDYRPMRLDEIDDSLQKEIRENCGVDVEMCMECGKCSGGCSNGHVFDYTPRKIIQLVKLNAEDSLMNMDALWICLSCHLCLDRCP